MTTLRLRPRRILFPVLWAAVTAGAAWALGQRRPAFDAPATGPALLGLLACTAPLPIWLFRRTARLETAAGFHFWLDFVKFGAAYFLNRGIWFS